MLLKVYLFSHALFVLNTTAGPNTNGSQFFICTVSGAILMEVAAIMYSHAHCIPVVKAHF